MWSQASLEKTEGHLTSEEEEYGNKSREGVKVLPCGLGRQRGVREQACLVGVGKDGERDCVLERPEGPLRPWTAWL